jgi:hypothetical protein
MWIMKMFGWRLKTGWWGFKVENGGWDEDREGEGSATREVWEFEEFWREIEGDMCGSCGKVGGNLKETSEDSMSKHRMNLLQNCLDSSRLLLIEVKDKLRPHNYSTPCQIRVIMRIHQLHPKPHKFFPQLVQSRAKVVATNQTSSNRLQTNIHHILPLLPFPPHSKCILLHRTKTIISKSPVTSLPSNQFPTNFHAKATHMAWSKENKRRHLITFCTTSIHVLFASSSMATAKKCN